MLGSKIEPKAYIDAAFAVYIRDSILTAAPHYLSSLSPYDYTLLDRIDRLTYFEAMYLLGRLGKRYVVLVVDEEKVADQPLTEKDVSRLFRWVRARVLKSLGQTPRKFGFFARADKEIIESIALFSARTHKNYALIRDYQNIAANLDRMDIPERKHRINRVASNMIDRFLFSSFRILLNQMTARPYGDINAKIFPALLFLSLFPNDVMDVATIAHYTDQSVDWTYRELLALHSTGFVQLNKDETGVRAFATCILTGQGVLFLNTLRDDVTSGTRGIKNNPL